jgi:hypothetical protein
VAAAPDNPAAWTEREALLIALAGQYHSVSYLANAPGVERKDAAERFPARATAQPA